MYLFGFLDLDFVCYVIVFFCGACDRWVTDVQDIQDRSINSGQSAIGFHNDLREYFSNFLILYFSIFFFICWCHERNGFYFILFFFYHRIRIFVFWEHQVVVILCRKRIDRQLEIEKDKIEKKKIN